MIKSLKIHQLKTQFMKSGFNFKAVIYFDQHMLFPIKTTKLNECSRVITVI